MSLCYIILGKCVLWHSNYIVFSYRRIILWHWKKIAHYLLYSSADVRPLNLDDFKYARDQVHDNVVDCYQCQSNYLFLGVCH